MIPWPLLKMILIGLLVAVVAGTLLGIKHEWDRGQKAIGQVRQIKVASRQVDVTVAKSDHAAAAAETKAQVRIVTRTRILLKKVPVYVSASPHPPVGCVTWGMLRLHDAAVLGVDPGSLEVPAGRADDTCSDTVPSAFMDAVVANYGAAEQNAEQLNALEKAFNDRASAVASVPAPF